MKRTRNLLATFLPPVVTGVAVGVCGVSGCTSSTNDTPTSERKVPTDGDKKPAFDEEEIESAEEAIKGVLPTDRVAEKSWLTRDDLSKKLPTFKPALIDRALEVLRDNREIKVFDDSGTLRYAKPESHRP
jgi:hypothetical protein